VEILIVKYGYLLLFFGVMVEGEAFLLAGAFLAQRGFLYLPLVALIAYTANCTAEQIYYLMARARGREWLEKRFCDNPHFQKLAHYMSRRADWLLLGSRFAFGFRIIIPAACGAFGMPTLRFTVLNWIAGIFWVVPVALLGFYFGDLAKAFLSGIQRYEWWILLGLALLAIAVLVFRHIRHMEWFADFELSDLHKLAPFLIGAMGVLNLISAFWPRSRLALQGFSYWFPMEVTQPSRPLLIFAGIALLQMTRNLAKRKALAWYVAVIALLISLITHITRGLDLQHSLVAGFLLLYLFYFRKRFYARTDPASLRRVLWMSPLLFLIVYLYGYIGLSRRLESYQWLSHASPVTEAFRSGILIMEPHVISKIPNATRFLGSLQIAGWLARLYLLFLILRPVIMRRRMGVPPGLVQAIFSEQSRFSLSAYAIQSDKNHLLVANGRGLIAYATRGHVALTCGDPLVPEDCLQEAVSSYIEYCGKNDWTPCIYEGSDAYLPVYQSLDLRSLKMSEEAIIDLKEFSLAGGKRAHLRAMVHKVARTGMTVHRYNRLQHSDPAIDDQLELISEEWLAEKHIGELGFTLGRFSLDSVKAVPVFYSMSDGKVQAFCSWLPYRGRTALVLDLLRRRSQSAPGTLDQLIAESLLQLQSEGWAEASLANAPLLNITGSRGTLERGVALLFENFNSFYGYKNLFQFKNKFAPRWEGRYLIYPKGADLLRVAYALTALHSSRGRLQLVFRR
jgi:lysylphosphatidylglycerol synthetase-like protein (DUF2156 family)/membrane protein DedA with SNARE-associated domain